MTGNSLVSSRLKFTGIVCLTMAITGFIQSIVVAQPSQVESVSISGLEAVEFLGVPFYDNDVFKLIVRFCFNLVFVSIIVFFAYFRNRAKDKASVRGNVFSFLMMNIVVFFLCFALKKLEVELGLALGLFAIFTILRFRTDAIGVKEMTYLFVVVGIAVINALSNKKTSYVELIFANTVIFAFAVILESLVAPVSKVNLSRQAIVYGDLPLLQPSRREELFSDLGNKLGINVERVEIKKVNFANGTSNLVVHFHGDSGSADDEERTFDDNNDDGE